MKPVLLLMTLIWFPFLSIFVFANPWLTERAGDSHPHIGFHVIATVVLVCALVVTRRVRAQYTRWTQRVLSGLLLVTIPLAMLGNLVELGTALGRLADDGWESRLTPDIFAGGAHASAASLTIPALMLSMLVVLALALVGAFSRGRHLEPVR